VALCACAPAFRAASTAWAWPAELLAYNGKGSRGGEPGVYGELNLPTEVVSSEFLTMEGKQFSSSRGVVIYVRDVLARYQPDALRYFIATAGPENQDTDFTWSEFVRRTNDELVAGWGNLVNRTASMINKNLGEIPAAGPLTDVDHALLASTEGAFRTVGDLLATHRQKAAVTEAMRVVGEANKYLSDTAPWKLKNADPERMKTVLHVAAQSVSDLRTVLSPFLPHSAQAVHEAFGGIGTVSPMPELREVADLDGGPGYPVLTNTYRVGENVAAWAPRPIVPGTPVPPAVPIFRKLDDKVVEEEIARLTSPE
jgi:methionyl-tRNA synthetase